MARCLVKLGCPEHKVKVQHLGVDVDRFAFKPRQWQPGETLKVLIAASFREKKGIPYAIEALGILSRTLPIELTIIGDSGSESASTHEKIKILHLLESTGLIANTRLLGFQPHSVMMQEAYCHHVFLQPSVTASDGDTEGGAPVSMIEMLATGMLVVSTKHCDIPEVMGDALQHMLVTERNSNELADCINLLTTRPDQWAALVAAGHKQVISQYHQATQGEQLLSLYEMLVHQ